MKLPDLLGVLGDVHCEVAALEAALELFRREGVERVLSVGDLVDGPDDANRTIELARAAKVEAVAGNHERWLLAGEMRTLDDATPAGTLTADNREWAATLPQVRTWSSAAGKVMLCHGVAEDDMTFFTADVDGYALETSDALQDLLRRRRCDVMIGGHTHQRMIRSLQGVVFLNAGTLSRRYAPGVIIIDLRARSLHEHDWAEGHFRRGATKRF